MTDSINLAVHREQTLPNNQQLERRLLNFAAEFLPNAICSLFSLARDKVLQFEK